ncbi:MAG: O-antigen ligase family protein [Sphingomonas sp.]
MFRERISAGLRRDARGAPPAGSLGGYVRENGWRRRRLLVHAVLLAFAFLYGATFTLVGQFFIIQFIAPLAVMALLLVWLLPDTGRAPVMALERLMLSFIIALCAWPDYLAVALPGLPWITAIRLVGAPMALVLLICVSVSPDFRARMVVLLNAVPAIWKMVTGFAVICLLSILFSKNVPNSIDRFVLAQMGWTSVFFASVWTFSRPGRARQAAAMLCGLLLFACLIGAYELRYSQVPWAGRVPWFLAVEDESVQRVLQGASRAATGIYRLQSKFTTSLGLGEFVGLTLPFVLHVIVTTRRMWVRLAGIAMLPLVLAVVVGTDSRLAVIGFGLTFLLYLLMAALLRWRQDKDSLFAPAIVFSYPATFMGVILASFFVARLKTMVWGGGAQQASTATRQQMYETGIPMVLRAPWGHGIGQGGPTLGFFTAGGTGTIDTYYLAAALEFGIIGFLVYFAMFLWAIWKSGETLLRVRDREVMLLAPLSIALINFVVSKSVFSQLENHPLAFAMLGMVVALIARQRALDAGEAEAATSGATLVKTK